MVARIVFFMIMALIFSCSDKNMEKGLICLRQGDSYRAIHFLEKAVVEDPENLVVRKALGQAYQQEITNTYRETRDTLALWQKMLSEYKIVYSQGDSSVSASLHSSWLKWCEYLLNHQDTSLAELQMDELIEWFPKSHEAMNSAALLFYHRSQWDKAEKLWIKAMTIDTTSITAPFNLGMSFWMRGDPRKALEHWVTAFERNPLDTNVISWMVEARKVVGY